MSSPRPTSIVTKIKPSKKLQRVLFVPDTHVPYHDRKAWALLLKAAAEFKPDITVILGDFADFYSVSSHDKRPDRARILVDELEEVRGALKELSDAGGSKKKIYVSGNHEDRYDRYIMAKAPEFFNLMSLPDVLGLKKAGWDWVPYKSHTTIGKLHITHDCGNAGQYAHYKAQNTFESNVIIGHTHRIGYAVVGNAEGKPHLGAMLGWLGDVEQVDYMHRIQVLKNWAHGFGVGYLLPDGCVHVTPLPIVNGGVVLEGKWIR